MMGHRLLPDFRFLVSYLLILIIQLRNKHTERSSFLKEELLPFTEDSIIRLSSEYKIFRKMH